jgi:hypothetical protein
VNKKFGRAKPSPINEDIALKIEDFHEYPEEVLESRFLNSFMSKNVEESSIKPITENLWNFFCENYPNNATPIVRLIHPKRGASIRAFLLPSVFSLFFNSQPKVFMLDRSILSEICKENTNDSLKFLSIQFFSEWTLEETKQKLISLYRLKNKIDGEIDLRIWKFDHTLSEQQLKDHFRTQLSEKQVTI